MAPEQLSPEGVVQRKREGQKAQYETRKEKIERPVEAGLFVKGLHGRKRIYTPEEAYEVAKRQRRESYHRFKARLDAAKALLVQAVPEVAEETRCG